VYRQLRRERCRRVECGVRRQRADGRRRLARIIRWINCAIDDDVCRGEREPVVNRRDVAGSQIGIVELRVAVEVGGDKWIWSGGRCAKKQEHPDDRQPAAEDASGRAHQNGTRG